MKEVVKSERKELKDEVDRIDIEKLGYDPAANLSAFGIPKYLNSHRRENVKRLNTLIESVSRQETMRR